MEVWSQWNALFAPGGDLIARLWGRRVGQLALPVEPLSVSRGMASTVRVVDDEHGDRVGAAWVRDLKSDGSKVYSGFYRVGRLPGNEQPHVHVSFPLESGSVQVFLTPAQRRRRILLVALPLSVFRRRRRLRRRPVRRRLVCRQTSACGRRFTSSPMSEGVLRTDHWLRVGPMEGTAAALPPRPAIVRSRAMPRRQALPRRSPAAASTPATAGCSATEVVHGSPARIGATVTIDRAPNQLNTAPDRRDDGQHQLDGCAPSSMTGPAHVFGSGGMRSSIRWVSCARSCRCLRAHACAVRSLVSRTPMPVRPAAHR